jgi:hypothetical protein
MIIYMKKPIKKPKRHFPYQHPTFGTKNRPSSERAWKRSVYYWWWAYLKRNPEYLKCCESKGKGELSALYKDFGDVRGYDFKSWWREGDRGATLFAEPPVEVSVRLLTNGDAIPDSSKGLSVYLPLNLPNNFLEKRVKELLNAIRKGKRGVQYGRADKSNALYKFDGQPNLKALENTLKVYDLIQEEKVKPAGVRMPYWKIALKAGIIGDKGKVLPTDSEGKADQKRAVMTAIVGRLKRRAEKSIKNSENGIFP